MKKVVKLVDQPLESALHKEIVEGAFNGERISLTRVRSQCPPGMMTRAMFQEKTGLSDVEMRSLIARGLIKPVAKSQLGWALYDDTTIEGIRKRPPCTEPKNKKLPSISKAGPRPTYSAAEALAVFQHIEKGTRLTEVAIDLGIHPGIVAAIQEDYRALERSVFVSHKTMDRINALEGRLEGSFPVRTEDDLLTLIYGAASRQLCACGKRRRKVCMVCARGKEQQGIPEGVKED